MVDPELVEGLEEAVEAVPGNRALRFHVIAFLLNGGMPERALSHVQWLLLYEPDNTDALIFAAHACEALVGVPPLTGHVGYAALPASV